MKKIIIFFIVFIITIILIIKVSYSTENIDFSEYYLKGFFKLDECHVEKDNKELCKKEYFSIYDNKIVSVSKIKDKDNYKENYKKVKNGIYKLITSEGSKIKIKVKDGYIKNFKLLSDLVGFKRSEYLIEDCYCKRAYFYFLFFKENKDIKQYNIGSINEIKNYNSKYYQYLLDKNIFLTKIKDKIFFNITDNDFFPYDLLGGNTFYFKLKNKNELILTEKDNNYDLKIQNCVVEYFNKDKLPLEF